MRKSKMARLQKLLNKMEELDLERKWMDAYYKEAVKNHKANKELKEKEIKSLNIEESESIIEDGDINE